MLVTSFPRNEPEILEKFLDASFRVERVKRHCEQLNLRQPLIYKANKERRSPNVSGWWETIILLVLREGTFSLVGGS
jgi:hypothetical protein